MKKGTSMVRSPSDSTHSTRDIELLFEIGTQRMSKRAWEQFFAPQVQNTTEHTYRVCWIAQVIAARELAAGHLGANDVDMGKMVRMALVHDLPESRTGDVHYISRQYTQRNETLAQEDIFAHTSIGDDMCELLEEYEQRRSWEAKIVKDADNLDCDIELKELAAMGSTLDTSLAATRRHVYETQFFTESARELWLETQTADPHAWHKNGRNRMKSGDWKKNA